jgi:hypothetical protein
MENPTFVNKALAGLDRAGGVNFGRVTGYAEAIRANPVRCGPLDLPHSCVP